jgi:hypothetical protein
MMERCNRLQTEITDENLKNVEKEMDKEFLSKKQVINRALKSYYDSLTTIDEHCDSAYRESQCKS